MHAAFRTSLIGVRGACFIMRPMNTTRSWTRLPFPAFPVRR